MSTIYKSDAGAAEIQRRYAEGLREWPVPAEYLRVPTRQGETFVIASGPAEAPPVLLLHGSGGNSAMWRGDIASWATHFRVYAIDIIGEPGRSAPTRPPLDSDAMADWLDEVREALGCTGMAIVGISLGGLVAAHYATRNPERVHRLALLCPSGIGRQTMGWVVKALPLRLLGRNGLRRIARLVTGLDGPRYESALDTSVLTFTHYRPRTERLPILPDAALRRLTMPVLIIVGERDVMLDSAETARQAREFIPNATVRVLPGVGHAIVEQTDAVQRFLLDQS
ncbi:alpha/beta fold hydrolase [Nocardia arthritidis]|uniref:Alpha/beta fold hydrolase n=1 Tax=Nocardia arthritidis TaxID=228602 RepID=A0A6G9YKE8_9NOCA|nr:alpha/beta fold hydrolase [Nocardia arthritidis]QIS13682.1 alpha/beta fold hydrolase [Nocardia arthritidis]